MSRSKEAYSQLSPILSSHKIATKTDNLASSVTTEDTLLAISKERSYPKSWVKTNIPATQRKSSVDRVSFSMLYFDVIQFVSKASHSPSENHFQTLPCTITRL